MVTLNHSYSQNMQNHAIRGTPDAYDDPIIHCKLFHAYGSGTWYLTEYDGNDTAFGYVTGLTENEWGYVCISELEALHIGGSIPRIECDLHFEPVCFSKLRILEGV